MGAVDKVKSLSKLKHRCEDIVNMLVKYPVLLNNGKMDCIPYIPVTFNLKKLGCDTLIPMISFNGGVIHLNTLTQTTIYKDNISVTAGVCIAIKRLIDTNLPTPIIEYDSEFNFDLNLNFNNIIDNSKLKIYLPLDLARALDKYNNLPKDTPEETTDGFN